MDELLDLSQTSTLSLLTNQFSDSSSQGLHSSDNPGRGDPHQSSRIPQDIAAAAIENHFGGLVIRQVQLVSSDFDYLSPDTDSDIGSMASSRALRSCLLTLLVSASNVCNAAAISSTDRLGAVSSESKLCSEIGVELLKRGVRSTSIEMEIGY